MSGGHGSPPRRETCHRRGATTKHRNCVCTRQALKLCAPSREHLEKHYDDLKVSRSCEPSRIELERVRTRLSPASQGVLVFTIIASVRACTARLKLRALADEEVLPGLDRLHGQRPGRVHGVGGLQRRQVRACHAW